MNVACKGRWLVDTRTAAPAGAGSVSIVSTGAIAGVDDAVVYGGELAGIFGPWSWQGEYIRADINRDGLPSASFDGWYAQTGYILTGETRPYSGDVGVVGRVKPKNPFSLKEGGWGAFEVLARYDTLDLNDEDAGITGGEVEQYGLGFNWYLRNNFRMMANYTAVRSDDEAVAPNDDPDVYHLRAQWDF
jgi:phosphate-selective porin OprO/OprP